MFKAYYLAVDVDSPTNDYRSYNCVRRRGAYFTLGDWAKAYLGERDLTRGQNYD